MKVTSSVGDLSNLKIFKPIQYLVIKGRSISNFSSIKIRARVVNSMSGRVEEIIPSMKLQVLGEICSMNEGFFLRDGSNGDYLVNVMLHPTSAVYLSNDKYLEVDVTDNGASDAIEIYGLESNVVDKDFVCRYNKFYMSAGELQKTFAVGENENLILPTISFSEITLQYNSGTSCSYTKEELGALMMLKNDLVFGYNRSQSAADTSSEKQLVLGYASIFGLDVADVSDFTIKREDASEAFELVMIDTIKD